MSEELIRKVDLKIKEELEKIDELERLNSEKVLNAFIKEQVAETDFNATTGYGYNDLGRDKIEKIYAFNALMMSNFMDYSIFCVPL